MPSTMSLPESLQVLAARAVGDPAVVTGDRSRPGSRSRVWRVEGPRGAAILKMHLDAVKHAREARAYRTWSAALPDGAPRLLAARDEPPFGLLLEALPGEVDPSPAAPAAAELHRQAGRWLARLHALPWEDEDAMPLAEAYERRARAWSARAAPALDEGRARTAQVRIDAMIPFLEGRSRVPCHRDFTPLNWLVEGERLVAVIDFEHARPDLPEADVARLAVRVWPEHDALREAFLDGYGPGLRAIPPPLLDGLRALEALGTIAWAAEHDDPAPIAAALAALDALGPSPHTCGARPRG